jgi:hypothetical protein
VQCKQSYPKIGDLSSSRRYAEGVSGLACYRTLAGTESWAPRTSGSCWQLLAFSPCLRYNRLEREDEESRLVKWGFLGLPEPQETSKA